MSYKTRPYLFPWPITFIPNPNRRFEVTKNHIIEYESFLGAFEKNARDLSLSDIKGTALGSSALRQKFTNSGRLVVRHNNGSKTNFDRIPNIAEFRNAVNGDNQNPEPTQMEKTFPAWHAELSDDDLADTAIIIPAPPQILTFIFQGTHGGLFSYYGQRNNMLCNKGDWVQEGQTIATLQPQKVKAPCSGRVRYISPYLSVNSYFWDKNSGWPVYYHTKGVPPKGILMETSIAIIQPLKNSNVPENYVEIAYEDLISGAERALSRLSTKSIKKLQEDFHRTIGNSKNPETARSDLYNEGIEALQLLTSAKNRYIAGMPIEAIPEWPSREWIAENAPNAGLKYARDPDLPAEEPSLNM